MPHRHHQQMQQQQQQLQHQHQERPEEQLSNHEIATMLQNIAQLGRQSNSAMSNTHSQNRQRQQRAATPQKDNLLDKVLDQLTTSNHQQRQQHSPNPNTLSHSTLNDVLSRLTIPQSINLDLNQISSANRTATPNPTNPLFAASNRRQNDVTTHQNRAKTGEQSHPQNFAVDHRPKLSLFTLCTTPYYIDCYRRE